VASESPQLAADAVVPRDVRRAMRPTRCLACCCCCGASTACCGRCGRLLRLLLPALVAAAAPAQLWVYLYCTYHLAGGGGGGQLCPAEPVPLALANATAVAGCVSEGDADWRPVASVAAFLTVHWLLFVIYAATAPAAATGSRLVRLVGLLGGDGGGGLGGVRRLSCHAGLLALLKLCIAWGAVDVAAMLPAVRLGVGWLPPLLCRLVARGAAAEGDAGGAGACVAPDWVVWAAVGAGCVTVSAHWLTTAGLALPPLLLRRRARRLQRFAVAAAPDEQALRQMGRAADETGATVRVAPPSDGHPYGGGADSLGGTNSRGDLGALAAWRWDVRQVRIKLPYNVTVIVTPLQV
jgi:hypothetical protein